MERGALQAPDVVKAAENFVCVKLNIDRHKVLAQQLGVKIVPHLAVTDPGGRTKVAERIGPSDAAAILALLKEAKDVLARPRPATGLPTGFAFDYRDRTGFTIDTEDHSLTVSFWTFHLAEALAFDNAFPGDTVRLRQSRIGMQATIVNDWTFLAQLDFAQPNPLLDVFLEYQFTRPVNLRVGRFKVPMGQQYLPRREFWDFVEPGCYGCALLPRRDLGAMVYGGGGLGGLYLRYWLGVFNGVQDGYSDEDARKDLAGRVEFSPFPSTDFNLTAAYAFTRGRARDSLDRFRLTTDSINEVFGFPAGSAYDGKRDRNSVEFELLYKNWSIGWERVWLSADVQTPAGGGDGLGMSADGAWIAWIVTGERKTRDERLRPTHALGAVELVARLQHLWVDKDLEPLARPGLYTPYSDAWAVGVNWYTTPYTRIMLDYQRARFDKSILTTRGRLADTQDAWMAGVQVFF